MVEIVCALCGAKPAKEACKGPPKGRVCPFGKEKP
jgi:hypothetical protein